MNIRAWAKVVGLGFVKWPLKLFVAPFAYPFIDKINNPIFGVRDATDASYYNIAIRNGCHNLFNRPDVPHTTTGNTDDDTLEALEGFQWRRRESKDGQYVSFRMTWGKPRRSKGKREFYIGWTMGTKNLNNEARMRLTFFQFRPF